jgi:hypothetical protein
VTAAAGAAGAAEVRRLRGRGAGGHDARAGEYDGGTCGGDTGTEHERSSLLDRSDRIPVRAAQTKSPGQLNGPGAADNLSRHQDSVPPPLCTHGMRPVRV